MLLSAGAVVFTGIFFRPGFKRNLGSYLEGPFVDPNCGHKYLCKPLLLLHISSFRIWMKGVSTESATLIFGVAVPVLITYVGWNRRPHGNFSRSATNLSDQVHRFCFLVG